MFHRHGFLSLALLCALSNIALGADAELKVPAGIQAPAGMKLLHKGSAKGVQIYVAVMIGNKLVWKLQAPRADVTVGNATWKHFAGPTWEADDGSKVKKVDEEDAVKKEPAPNAKNDIHWLLIKVAPNGEKKGVLSGVQFVQRINTKGGQMPEQPPLKADDRIEVDYTSDYLFYGN